MTWEAAVHRVGWRWAVRVERTDQLYKSWWSGDSESIKTFWFRRSAERERARALRYLESRSVSR